MLIDPVRAPSTAKGHESKVFNTDAILHGAPRALLLVHTALHQERDWLAPDIRPSSWRQLRVRFAKEEPERVNNDLNIVKLEPAHIPVLEQVGVDSAVFLNAAAIELWGLWRRCRHSQGLRPVLRLAPFAVARVWCWRGRDVLLGEHEETRVRPDRLVALHASNGRPCLREGGRQAHLEGHRRGEPEVVVRVHAHLEAVVLRFVNRDEGIEPSARSKARLGEGAVIEAHLEVRDRGEGRHARCPR
mmetsp:Transcript_22973/g.65233  ORF Transcript_22973/g.65233 Transcript_22973/m.65233 type:complete len:245 (-) Transcript_22973:26-760(-)